MARLRTARRVLKAATVTALSLAALLSLGFMLVGYVQAILRQPPDPMEKTDYSDFSGPTWENSRCSLYVAARDGQVEFTRYSKRCLSCGGFRPDHAVGCFHTMVSVSYVPFYRVDKRFWLPGIDWKSGVSMSEFTELTISLWLPFVVFAAYPTVTFIRGPFRRHRRRKRGACLDCGYDLAGNVSGVCPECGQGV